MADTVTGIFSDWDAAMTAYERLREAGFHADHVNLLSADREGPTRPKDGSLEHEHEGATIGAAAGGALGAAGGWAVGLAALTVPGVGPILAAGPIMGAIAGLAAGAGAGGLLGYMIGAGAPDEEYAPYHDAFEQGHVLVTVTEPGREGEAESHLRAAGALQVHRRPAAEDDAPQPTGNAGDVSPVDPGYVAGTAGSPNSLSTNDMPPSLEVPGAHTAGIMPQPGLTYGVVTTPGVDARYVSPTSGSYEGGGPADDVGTMGVSNREAVEGPNGEVLETVDQLPARPTGELSEEDREELAGHASLRLIGR